MQILTLSVKQGWSCHHDARFSVAQLLSFFLSHFIATFELGQKMESHHLVPFAAAPTPFRKYAATRSLACGGCHMHTDSKKQSFESFAHCTMHPHRKAHFIFGTSIINRKQKAVQIVDCVWAAQLGTLIYAKATERGFQSKYEKKAVANINDF